MKQSNKLPKGYRARPATLPDLEAIVQMFNAWSRYVMDKEKFTLADTRYEWGTPGFNMEKDTRVVLAPDNNVAGYYEIWDLNPPHTRILCWGRIHPEHWGKGVGTYLLSWAEDRARISINKAPPEARVTLQTPTISSESSAKELFQNQGFSVIRYFMRMIIELDNSIPEPGWPEGITVRSFSSTDKLVDVVKVVRETFRDHWGHIEKPLDDEILRWEHEIENYEHFDPELWFLAMFGKEIIGVSLCYSKTDEDPDMGWIRTLGVRRKWRRMGVGLALLYHSFHTFRLLGRKRVGLGVDAESLTGATRLYEKAGMQSDPDWLVALFEKELRPGVQIRSLSL